jgi:NADPH:quinone reductase-like Zn-dependent oxidoreductase
MSEAVKSSLIEAIQNHDTSQFLSCFHDNAILIDESIPHNTATTMQSWFEKGLVAHKATIQVLNSGGSDSKEWIHVRMDGDYETDYGITESFDLYFHIALQNDKIQHLRINQYTPDTPTMRAVWAAKGEPNDPLKALRNDIWKIPHVPEGWVRVKVKAVGLNYHDIFTLRGLGMFDLKFPLILGNEGTGTLEDGKEVIIFPVMGNPNFKGDVTLDPDRHVLGELTQGSLAEYVVVPRENVVEKPKGMKWETAAVLGIAWLTAYRMLFTRSGLKKGQKMLVQGSTGGVATALIQLGCAAGMTVWCTGRTEEKRELAKKLGAHRTFLPGEQLPEKVAAVFDMSGEKTFKHSMESVGTGGTIVSCGLHSGGMFTEVDLMKLFTQQINIHGTYAGTKGEFEELVAFVDEHAIIPHISKVLPLEKAGEGLRAILDGQVLGKVVVKV